MNIHTLFPSKYIKGDDVEKGQGGRVTLAIKRWSIEEMGQDKEEHPVLWFNGTDKGLVLKKGNAMTIAGLYGPEMDAWAGKRITLYVERMRAFGGEQKVVRVAKQVPPPPQPKMPPPPEPVPQDLPAPKLKFNAELNARLRQVVALSNRHDSLFEESSDVTELRELMRSMDSIDLEPMPTKAAPGKPMSMYSYLLEQIDGAVSMDGAAEPILTYLLGRVVTGETPPTLDHRFLIEDLRGDREFVDALLATNFIVNEQVPA